MFRRRVTLVATVLACLHAVVTHAGRGDMDPGFAGGAGRLIAPTVTLADGRFLTLQGNFAEGIQLTLRDAGGIAIPSWGVLGSVKVPAGLDIDFRSRAVQTVDQGMLLAGSRPRAGGGNPGSDFAVVKLTAAGQLDMAFGAGGVLTRPATAFPAGYTNACGEFAQGIAI